MNVVAGEPYNGENLITPYEQDNSKWTLIRQAGKDFKSVLWRSKLKGMADAYIINIQDSNISSLKHTRETQDEPGRRNCASFQSIDLEAPQNKKHESVMWRTTCTKEKDFKAQILHLAIKGKDSIYHLQKIWVGKTPDKKLQKWTNMFKEVYVCDTRTKEKQCPSDYEKIKILFKDM